MTPAAPRRRAAGWTTLPRPLASEAALDRLATLLPNLERDPRFRRGEVELSLERTQALLRALRQPLRGIAVIHVAGSKGKGSTCLLASAVLAAHGVRVGTYLSPHVDSWTERVQVDGRPIAVRELGRCLTTVLAAAHRAGLGAPTLFEALTVAAFVAFRRAGVAVAVVEVGIGGLRDATNVVVSDVAVVTSIEREHTAVLGRTRAAIAAQKAGIFKRGAAAISGVHAWTSEAAVIRGAAKRVGARCAEWGRALAARRRPGRRSAPDRCDIAVPGFRAKDLPAPPGGRFAVRSLALALAAVAALARRRPRVVPPLQRARIESALSAVRLPGRFERIGERPPTWRDGAHTPASLRAAVRDAARAAGGPPVVVLALKRDKPLVRCLRALAGACGPVVATTLPDGSCYDPKEIVAAAGPLGIMARPCARPAAALALARRWARQRDRTAGAVLVTGSFWLAGAIGGRRRPRE